MMRRAVIAAATRKPLTMMIVDDSRIIRNKIGRAQQIAGLQVVAAAVNGREAIAMFRRELPDLVTMDITMPEIDGIQCIEHILKLRADTRILVVSALADKATAIEALKRGAQGFLCKPFTDRELNNALEELINGGVA